MQYDINKIFSNYDDIEPIMDLRNFRMNPTKPFGKKWNIFFYKIQNGGKSKEAHLMATINLFVEQVQVNKYTEFQNNRS